MKTMTRQTATEVTNAWMRVGLKTRNAAAMVGALTNARAWVVERVGAFLRRAEDPELTADLIGWNRFKDELGINAERAIRPRTPRPARLTVRIERAAERNAKLLLWLIELLQETEGLRRCQVARLVNAHGAAFCASERKGRVAIYGIDGDLVGSLVATVTGKGTDWN